MKVKEIVKQLLELNQEKETFMFLKTPDGKCVFTSDISIATNGAVFNEYGQLVEGVLVMKEIPRK